MRPFPFYCGVLKHSSCIWVSDHLEANIFPVHTLSSHSLNAGICQCYICLHRLLLHRNAIDVFGCVQTPCRIYSLVLGSFNNDFMYKGEKFDFLFSELYTFHLLFLFPLFPQDCITMVLSKTVQELRGALAFLSAMGRAPSLYT